jgi:hypothetical protein
MGLEIGILENQKFDSIYCKVPIYKSL